MAPGVVKLQESARRGELVAVIGSGVSVGLTNGTTSALSWKGLVKHGFEHAARKGKITPPQAGSWKAQIDSNDLDELLAAAEFLGRKLGAPAGQLYARWLEEVFQPVQPANPKLEQAIRSLPAAGIRLCTLNYDPLLERVTGLPAVNLSETSKVIAWMRGEDGILHLHGSWDAPATCVLGIRDYEETVGNDVRDLIQRSLGTFRRMLFIGCGETFADPNFTALIHWLRKFMCAAAPQHYALVTDDEVAARHADATWQGFVEPVGYGPAHADLVAFLLERFPPVQPGPESGAGAPAASSAHAALLREYRAFVLKDCGQMTIEGLQAGMKVTLRKFDLERLFVPLEVLPAPPEFPDTEPGHEQKLVEWQEENDLPLPFGDVFAKHPRLALLALPGGGKTLLLKRLAVAYADPARRHIAADALPDLDLTPVVIRCREWRQQIHKPIPTLLNSIPEVTGQASLAGLGDAFLPEFNAGRILLLVDGLDEIREDDLRSTFVDHLESFLADYSLTRLVVTSREAGFSLVAPALARFCVRWRVAPLSLDAIRALCDHWHRLMTDTPGAQEEGEDVAEELLENESLRHLAENPLLLTMLLVVKHGGRLPPDRVTLYTRAVEVLLDSWNIKGHLALGLKEAVPQLAFVAFELMRDEKQTVTEPELLRLLEEAREKVPRIGRYATDTPQRFLKRVELRSSLLVQAGYQMERRAKIPFYQFRHLTFQEYLAAVAAAEGYYAESNEKDTVLTPLAEHVTAEGWKEVIPMSAVLAGKRADPLLAELVERGNELRRHLDAGEDFEGKQLWNANTLPSPIDRLLRCLLEEAEAGTETLTAALQLVALFAKECLKPWEWQALSRGPYGEELMRQAWLLYEPLQYREEMWLRFTCANIAFHRHPKHYWTSPEGEAELQRLLGSEDAFENGLGLLFYCGLHSNHWMEAGALLRRGTLVADLERHLFHRDLPVAVLATWAWALTKRLEHPPHSHAAILDRFLSMWLDGTPREAAHIGAVALCAHAGMPRSVWKPDLTAVEVQKVREIFVQEQLWQPAAAVVVGFYARTVWDDGELACYLADLPPALFAYGTRPKLTPMMEELGEAGQPYIDKLKGR
jgi:hypothetical protein